MSLQAFSRFLDFVSVCERCPCAGRHLLSFAAKKRVWVKALMVGVFMEITDFYPQFYPHKGLWGKFQPERIYQRPPDGLVAHIGGAGEPRLHASVHTSPRRIFSGVAQPGRSDARPHQGELAPGQPGLCSHRSQGCIRDAATQSDRTERRRLSVFSANEAHREMVTPRLILHSPHTHTSGTRRTTSCLNESRNPSAPARFVAQSLSRLDRLASTGNGTSNKRSAASFSIMCNSSDIF